MRSARHIAFVAVAVLGLAAPASAEVKTFRDWIAACDNVRNCTAYALNENSGTYLRLDRDGARDAPPRFVIVSDVPQGAKIEIAFDDATLGGLPKGAFTPKIENDLARIEIGEDAREAFIASLRKAARITVTNVDAPKPDERIVGEISLSGAVATLLWIDEQQKRLGTVTALVRRGSKPASAVPAPLAVPTITGAKPGTAEIPRTFPTAVLARGRGICGADEPNPKPADANRLSGNLLLYWFECPALSGAYNAFSGMVLAPSDNPAAARVVRLPYPPGEAAIEGIDKMLVVNAAFGEKDLTITQFAKGRGPGDCGSSGEWIFDGKQFRLARYQSMPKCAGLISDDWPVIYRTQVK